MNLDIAVKTINSLLEKEQPKTFSSSWISVHSPSVYQFIRTNFRTENDHVDWDRFTYGLERKYLKRWTHYKRKPAKSYENQAEVDLIITKYQDKIYTFVAPIDDTDWPGPQKLHVDLV